MGAVADVVSTVANPVTAIVDPIAEKLNVDLTAPGGGVGKDLIKSGINTAAVTSLVGPAAGATVQTAGIVNTGINYAKEQGRKAREQAEGAMNEQAKQFQGQLDELTKQQEVVQPKEEAKAVERAKRRVATNTRQGRASTILTSPLGIVGDNGPTPRKTLLGM